MSTTYFNDHVLPYLQVHLDDLSSADVTLLRQAWATFAKLRGVRVLAKSSEHVAIAELFAATL